MRRKQKPPVEKCLWIVMVHLLHFSSVQSLSRVWPHGLQHTRPPCPSPTPRVYSNSCPLSQWCHPTISSSVVPFSSHLQSFPVSGSFQMSQLFASGGQSIGFSASVSVRSIPFLSFIEPIFSWNVPLVSLMFSKRSLVLDRKSTRLNSSHAL